MLRVVFSCLILFAVCGLAPAKQEAVFSEQVHLEISSAKSAYYLREPLQLNLTLRNQSIQEVTGVFNLSLSAAELEVYYRKVGSTFKKYTCGRQIGRTLPLTLAPAEQYIRQEIVLFDTKERKFVLDEIGNYEFKVIYRETPNDPSRVLKSNIITIGVISSLGEDEALGIYSDEELARLIQGDIDSIDQYRVAINRCIALAEAYPNSIYTKHLRKAQIDRLKRKMDSPYVLNEEKRLYSILKRHSEGDIE